MTIIDWASLARVWLLYAQRSWPAPVCAQWNAVSLSNSEPKQRQLEIFTSVVLYVSDHLYFKWRASLVPAAAVIPAPLAIQILLRLRGS